MTEDFTMAIGAKFKGGNIAMTPGALELFSGEPEAEKLTMFPSDSPSKATIPGKTILGMAPYLIRHFSGDWGDVESDDADANEAALEHDGRIFSVYKVDGTKIWIITEADRSRTTVMLPEEY